ncbi:hypothetical protein [Burkholderia cepacia]|uniref:hypothetical protein n=1 Tax=Burkholderia cepacia TaxID=292 RepID=UPI0029907EE7|nr:hypothetical protein [Burkholderia cepacia]
MDNNDCRRRLSSMEPENSIKNLLGVAPHHASNTNRYDKNNKFGCPVELFSVTKEIIAGGATFFRKRASKIHDLEISDAHQKNNFIVGVSLSAGHRREILSGQDFGVYKFRKHAIHIRNSNEPYSARIHGDYDFVVADISRAWLTQIDGSTLRSGVYELLAPAGHVDNVLGNLVRCLFPPIKYCEK